MTSVIKPLLARFGTATAIVCIAAVVVTLAVIQYRWNQQASDATGVRLADSLQLSMINWHLDLFRNLSEVGLTMRMPVETEAQDDQYARQFAEWRSIARYPELVASISIVRRPASDRVEVVRVAPDRAVLDRSLWPVAVERVVSYLDQVSGAPAAPAQVNGQLTESFYNIGSALRVWQFDPAGPALVRLTSPGTEWLVVELDERVLRERILPDLAHRYFQGTDGLDYEVAVVTGRSQRPGNVVYTSDVGFGETEVPDADGRMDVFGRTDACGRIDRSGVPSDVGEFGADGGGWRELVSALPRDAGRR